MEKNQTHILENALQDEDITRALQDENITRENFYGLLEKYYDSYIENNQSDIGTIAEKINIFLDFTNYSDYKKYDIFKKYFDFIFSKQELYSHTEYKEEFLGKYYDLYYKHEEYISTEDKKEILKKIIEIYGKIKDKNTESYEFDKKINKELGYKYHIFYIPEIYYDYLILLDEKYKEYIEKYKEYIEKYKEYVEKNETKYSIKENIKFRKILYFEPEDLSFLKEDNLEKRKKIAFSLVEELMQIMKIFFDQKDIIKDEDILNYFNEDTWDDLLINLYNLGIYYGFAGENTESIKYLNLAFKYEDKLKQDKKLTQDEINKYVNSDFGKEIKDVFIFNDKLFEEQKQEAEKQKQEAEKQKAELESDLEKHNLETEKLKLRSNNNLEYHLIKSALSKLGQDNIDGYFEPKLNEIVKEVKKDERIKNLKDDNDIIKEILKNNADYQIYKYFKDKSKGWFRLLVLDKIGFLKEYLEKKDYPFYNKAKQKASEDDLDYILPAIRVGYLGQWKDIISRNMDKFDKLKDQYLKHIGGSKREENRNLFKNEEIESIEKLYSKEMEFFKESNSNMEKIVTKFDIIMREKQDRDQKKKIFGKVMWFFSIESIVVLGGVGFYLFINGGESISTNNVILISIIVSVTLSQITLMMYHIIKNLYILPNEQVEKMNIDKIFDMTKILQDKIIDSNKK